MAKLKVGLLYEITVEPWGGVNTFFRNFTRHAANDDRVELVNTYARADIYLSVGHRIGQGKTLNRWHLKNISHGFGIRNPLGIFLNKGKKQIIFRLDGLRKVYAPEAGEADDLLIENMNLADSVVFQSNFSRDCFDFLKINITYYYFFFI